MRGLALAALVGAALSPCAAGACDMHDGSGYPFFHDGVGADRAWYAQVVAEDEARRRAVEAAALKPPAANADADGTADATAEAAPPSQPAPKPDAKPRPVFSTAAFDAARAARRADAAPLRTP